jgi:hypothetical protein
MPPHGPIIGFNFNEITLCKSYCCLCKCSNHLALIVVMISFYINIHKTLKKIEILHLYPHCSYLLKIICQMKKHEELVTCMNGNTYTYIEI